MVDYGVFGYKTPSFNDLMLSQGTVYVSRPAKGGNRFNLMIDGKRIRFSCTIISSYDYSCLDRKKYDGLPAKVWWYEFSAFGSVTTKVIYQIEIAGNNLINYKSQKKKYSEEKNHTHI